MSRELARLSRPGGPVDESLARALGSATCPSAAPVPSSTYKTEWRIPSAGFGASERVTQCALAVRVGALYVEEDGDDQENIESPQAGSLPQTISSTAGPGSSIWGELHQDDPTLAPPSRLPRAEELSRVWTQQAQPSPLERGAVCTEAVVIFREPRLLGPQCIVRIVKHLCGLDNKTRQASQAGTPGVPWR